MRAISIPDTLTTENSGNYIVSIRLWPGGFSFSGYNPSVDDSFFYSETSFDRSAVYATALKEQFYSYEFLTWSYKAIHIIYVTPQYTLVPKGEMTEVQKRQTFSFCFSEANAVSLADDYRKGLEAEILFGVDEEVYAFCNRTFGNPTYYHHLSTSIALWKKQSLSFSSRQLFVVLHHQMMDLVGIDQGKLLFANSYSIEKVEDALYYVLYVWKQQELDVQKDLLYVGGDLSLYRDLTVVLRDYLCNISPIPVPSEAYLVGSNVMKAPVDVISYLICEL